MRNIGRFIAAFALVAANAALAGTVEQRSPFVQGNWWNPDRSGSGIEIFNSGDQTMALWYTYDGAGRPVWYTAQGATSTIGTASWPLLKHRWANGKKADPATVGSFKVSFSNVQSGQIEFTIDGVSGKWTIQPFVATSMIGDVDHSGSWYDPTNSGWGFTVIQQADVLGGALFTYDAGGEPVWLSGFERGTNSIGYLLYSGTCPTCTYKQFTTQAAGRLTFDFRDEYHATVHSALTLAMAPGVNIDGADVMQFSRPMSFRSVDRELANFSDDFSLKAFLQEGMLNAQPAGAPVGGFSAGSPSPVPYSTTNLQEAGVDEADVVKNTATMIYTFAHDASGVRQPSVRMVTVGGLGNSLGTPTTLPLSMGSAGSQYLGYAGLYADDNVLVAITGNQPYVYGAFSPWSGPGYWAGTRTYVEIFDVSAGAPQSKWNAQFDGGIVASRRIGKILYLVTRSSPTPGVNFTYFATPGSAADLRNHELVAQMSLADLLPSVRVNGAAATRAVQASDLYVPPQGMRKRSADTMLITAIDLEKRQIVQTLGISGSAETVYVSPNNLYLASSRYELRAAGGAITTFDPYGAATDIHQIRLGENGMTFVASGSVDGVIGSDMDKAPFQLSEDGGRLRVVSQSNSLWGINSKNRLTILEPAVTSAGTVLKSVSYIPSIFNPEPLGKPGEFLHSTRFTGDRLYAVTFKKIDPLYVVDLSNAAAPRIAGALEAPTFSDYLHPLGNGLLLGFGKETAPAVGPGDGQFAWYQGLMLALYDVSDPKRINELYRGTVGKRGSDSAALRDHHAFSTLKIGNSTIVAFPARINSSPVTSTDPSYYYPWQSSGLMRFEVREGATAQAAALYTLDNLMTHPPATQNDPDPSTTNGRAVIYPNATIYVGNGKFWRLDAFGKSAGPF